jgi:repressor LexA
VSASLGQLISTRRRELGLTLQQLADKVGCAKSYLSIIEHERRPSPPSDDILTGLESALDLPAGTLLQAARWMATPAPIRSEVTQLQSAHKAAQRLAEILSESRAQPNGTNAGSHGKPRTALDEAHRSGELKRLIDRIAPPAPETASQPALTPRPPQDIPLINKVAAGYPREFTDLGYPVRIADEYVRSPDIADPEAFACRVVGDSMAPDYREGDIVVFSPAKPVKSGADCFARIEPDHESTFKRAYFETDPERGELIRLQPLNPAYPARTFPREQVAGLYAAVSVTRSLA